VETFWRTLIWLLNTKRLVWIYHRLILRRFAKELLNFLLSEHQAAKFRNRNAPVRNDVLPHFGQLEKWKISQCRLSNCTTRLLLASQFCHWHSTNRTTVQGGGYYLHDFITKTTNIVWLQNFAVRWKCFKLFNPPKWKNAAKHYMHEFRVQMCSCALSSGEILFTSSKFFIAKFSTDLYLAFCKIVDSLHSLVKKSFFILSTQKCNNAGFWSFHAKFQNLPLHSHDRALLTTTHPPLDRKNCSNLSAASKCFSRLFEAASQTFVLDRFQMTR